MSKFPVRIRAVRWTVANILLVAGLLGLAMSTRNVPTVQGGPLTSVQVRAIPAFARKYGLPCSACHTAWPELNNFGQVFRDNGYQLGHARDSPIVRKPSYFPITFRITPQ